MCFFIVVITKCHKVCQHSEEEEPASSVMVHNSTSGVKLFQYTDFKCFKLH